MRLKSSIHLTIALACAAALTACGGGSSSGSNYNPPFGGGYGGGYGGTQCDPGTNVELANPLPNAYGVPTSTSSITIVADGNSNALYNSYSNWTLILQGTYGPITGGNLSLVSDTNGPHPYPSDYYYSAPVQSLPGGESFQVQIVNNSAYCNPITIGQFST